MAESSADGWTGAGKRNRPHEACSEAASHGASQSRRKEEDRHLRGPGFCALGSAARNRETRRAPLGAAAPYIPLLVLGVRMPDADVPGVGASAEPWLPSEGSAAYGS
jgi:hypothetical protein